MVACSKPTSLMLSYSTYSYIQYQANINNYHCLLNSHSHCLLSVSTVHLPLSKVQCSFSNICCPLPSVHDSKTVHDSKPVVHRPPRALTGAMYGHVSDQHRVRVRRHVWCRRPAAGADLRPQRAALRSHAPGRVKVKTLARLWTSDRG